MRITTFIFLVLSPVSTSAFSLVGKGKNHPSNRKQIRWVVESITKVLEKEGESKSESENKMNIQHTQKDDLVLKDALNKMLFASSKEEARKVETILQDLKIENKYSHE